MENQIKNGTKPVRARESFFANEEGFWHPVFKNFNGEEIVYIATHYTCEQDALNARYGG